MTTTISGYYVKTEGLICNRAAAVNIVILYIFVVEVVQRLQMNESKSLMKIQFQVAVVLLI